MATAVVLEIPVTAGPSERVKNLPRPSQAGAGRRPTRRRLFMSAMALVLTAVLPGCWSWSPDAGSRSLGIDYKWKSGVDYDAGVVKAATEIWRNDGNTLGYNYVGVAPRLYYTNGALCYAWGFAYNSNYTTKVFSRVGTNTCSAGVRWYSKGQVRVYSGVGSPPYSTYDTLASTIEIHPSYR